MLNTEKTMDKIVALAKNRGFILPGSDIYGGLANTWDYAPLGVELKRNIKNEWWKRFVKTSPYNVGMDAAILMNPQVWVASGHVAALQTPSWTVSPARPDSGPITSSRTIRSPRARRPMLQAGRIRI